MESGLCRQQYAAHAERWFPKSGDATTPDWAKAVCERCPVRVQCLEYAVMAKEHFGIWGGASARERKVLASSTRVA